jgi:hypothetical protein
MGQTNGTDRWNTPSIFTHLVYDGVYASKEDRIRGGGCLELRKYVSEILGLADNELTGN